MSDKLFGHWLEKHIDHVWAITMACDGDKVGAICDCFTCGTVEEFGIDPIEVMMKHWKDDGGREEGNGIIATA